MEAEGCPVNAELSVVVGDDRWIQELNRQYRKTNAPTDVLAFPQGKGRVGCPELIGDVALSGETAARQAKAFGHKLREELAVLLVHGILHLTGWQDKTQGQRRSMMRRTEELLDRARECQAP
jgi:probable rRNA maturation factor